MKKLFALLLLIIPLSVQGQDSGDQLFHVHEDVAKFSETDQYVEDFKQLNEIRKRYGYPTGYSMFQMNGNRFFILKPIESLSEGLLISVRDAMDSMFHQDTAVAGMVDEFHIDGVVFHPIKSCRTVSTGLADSRRALADKRDVPSLFIESDMMDRRVVSEAQMKNRIDAFFEGMKARRDKAAINR